MSELIFDGAALSADAPVHSTPPIEGPLPCERHDSPRIMHNEVERHFLILCRRPQARHYRNTFALRARFRRKLPSYQRELDSVASFHLTNVGKAVPLGMISFGDAAWLDFLYLSSALPLETFSQAPPPTHHHHMPKQERNIVPCWCAWRCSPDGGQPKYVIAKTRLSHLRRDEEDLAFARRLSLPTVQLLQEAVDKNRIAIEPPRSPTPGAPADDEHPAPTGDHLLDELVYEDDEQFFLDAEQEHHDEVDDNLDNISDASSSIDFPASASSVDHVDLPDVPLSPEDRQALDLHLFYDEGSDSDGELDHPCPPTLPPSSPATSVRGTQQRFHRPQDRGTQSLHGQVLLDAMINDYSPGPRPEGLPSLSSSSSTISNLSPSERATLKHFRTWIRTGGTVRAYDEYAKNFNEENKDGAQILSRKLAVAVVKKITQLQEQRWDMCPQSCMAFVGPHSDLEYCTTVNPKAKGPPAPCGEARYDSRGRPRKQFVTIPILPRVRARFASKTATTYLHERAEAAASSHPDERIYQDWGDGMGHQALREEGLFDDARHDAIFISLDGAQMVEKKKSEGWLVLLSSMNSPLSERFLRTDTFIASIMLKICPVDHLWHPPRDCDLIASDLLILFDHDHMIIMIMIT
ncbi:hypothetical protein CF326_g1755 [Tilletia indica]|nr:hypothetical protein CF326_g1755 [Tilletia indica]